MESLPAKQRRAPWTQSGQRKRPRREKPVGPKYIGAADDVLDYELKSFKDEFGPCPVEKFEEVEVTIEEQVSTGDGVAFLEGEEGQHSVLVPFTLPGEKVIAKIYFTESTYSKADLVKVLEPSPSRDDSLVKCQYFGKCAGCQFQMVPYENQLEFKRNIILKAFERYFPSQSHQIPAIDPTNPSPLQYGYRTKITPHFDIPRGVARRHETMEAGDIGFHERTRSKVMDIEECPISTAVVNEGLMRQRAFAKTTTYARGATLLCRESLGNSKWAEEATGTPSEATSTEPSKICITDHKAIVTEQVGKYTFKFPAGSFFQNNNAILPDFTRYVRDQLFSTAAHVGLTDKPKYLVDAYCGSGLFSVTCAEGFETVTGVEITADSVKWATQNAELNNLPNATFITGSADEIFKHIKTPPDQTAVIIDPPRKGCDDSFLRQLRQFSPRIIVYVSCNVHTQARDIKTLFGDEKHYRVSAVRGFDLFPQTQHVESIATIIRDH